MERKTTVVLGWLQRLSDTTAMTLAPREVLISSLRLTSRRGSYFRQRAGSTVRTGRVVFPIIDQSFQN